MSRSRTGTDEEAEERDERPQWERRSFGLKEGGEGAVDRGIHHGVTLGGLLELEDIVFVNFPGFSALAIASCELGELCFEGLEEPFSRVGGEAARERNET